MHCSDVRLPASDPGIVEHFSAAHPITRPTSSVKFAQVGVSGIVEVGLGSSATGSASVVVRW